MTRSLLRAGLTLALGIGAATLSAADPDTPAPPAKLSAAEKAKAPDFSGYADVTRVMGEVVKATDGSVTIRIYWQAVTAKKTSSGRGNRNTRNRRPQLHQNHGRSYSNPYSVRRPQVQVKTEHHDYELEYVLESLVRTKNLPPKFGADGKKAAYTEAERDELKVPYTVPGYAASKTDLTPGTVVEVFVIRDKTIPAAKVTENDLRVKYALIVGHDPNPPKDITSPGKPDPKKKN